MKILTVEFEESFYVTIGSNIVKIITFPTNEVGNVKFGFEAPRDVQVNREEIYESMKSQKVNEY